jgi:PTH1 family peptidyl-tRNA hydrolase
VGTLEVPRLRIGICQEDLPLDYSEFVLSNFGRREKRILEQEVLDRAAQAVESFLTDGMERAMALYN